MTINVLPSCIDSSNNFQTFIGPLYVVCWFTFADYASGNTAEVVVSLLPSLFKCLPTSSCGRPGNASCNFLIIFNNSLISIEIIAFHSLFPDKLFITQRLTSAFWNCFYSAVIGVKRCRNLLQRPLCLPGIICDPRRILRRILTLQFHRPVKWICAP